MLLISIVYFTVFRCSENIYNTRSPGPSEMVQLEPGGGWDVMLWEVLGVIYSIIKFEVMVILPTLVSCYDL
jgi:hypothetical protein